MNPIGRLFSRFFRERIFCGLDIGSQRIKASISRVQDADNFQLLAVHEVETRGLRDASVNDIGELSGAISAAISGVMKRAKVKVRDVYLGVGGDLVSTRMSRSLVPLTERGNKVIVPSDVKDARHQARLLGVKLDEEVIEDLVRQFRVDDVNVALDPVGLYGRKLEVESLLVVMSVARLRNIEKAVKQAGYEINDVFFNGAALSEAALDRQRRQDGCVLVDIGARSTEVIVFKDGLIKNFDVLPWGGDTISARLAAELGIPLPLAEDIKKTYACVGDSAGKGKDEVLIKKDQGFVPVKREVICRVVEQELAVLVTLLKTVVAGSGYDGQLRGGLVMAGGGALLTGLMEYVEKAVGMPVTMARNIPGLNQALLYAVSTSLAEMGYKGSMRYIFDQRRPRDWWDAFRIRMEELCNEYF